MTRAARIGFRLLTVGSLTLMACQLHRPATTPTRVLEPQLLEPPALELRETATKNPNAISIRLLSTESRGNIGRRVLHRQPDGELIEDAVWRWSAPPDRYLDTAIRIELAVSPTVRLVNAGDVPTLAANLLEWHLESSGGTQLVGVVEFEMTGSDRVIHTKIVRGNEHVPQELPGHLASAAGHLMRGIASEGLSLVMNER